jgi:hypothetical protein
VTVELGPTTNVTRRWRGHAARGAVVLFLLLVAFGAAVWFCREALLRGAADLWIVSDPVGPADAAAILGGGLSVRPFAAAEYYRKGLVQKILVADLELSKPEAAGILPSHTALNRTALVKLGVPETAIEIFGLGLLNTYKEAVALREWAVRTGALNVIVPTEIFSSRRVRWVLNHALAGTGVHVQVPALDHPDYSRREWWRSDKGVVAFQNEIIKYIYYRFKY